uniref:Secreted protein n=1 Tax=Zea mays TaxID=4577 RepID=A0A804RIJ1_MAIZE
MPIFHLLVSSLFFREAAALLNFLTPRSLAPCPERWSAPPSLHRPHQFALIWHAVPPPWSSPLLSTPLPFVPAFDRTCRTRPLAPARLPWVMSTGLPGKLFLTPLQATATPSARHLLQFVHLPAFPAPCFYAQPSSSAPWWCPAASIPWRAISLCSVDVPSA